MQQRSRTLRQLIRDAFVFPEGHLTPRERHAVNERLLEINEVSAIALMVCFLVYFITGLPLIPFTVLPEFQTPVFAVHMASLVLLGAIWYRKFSLRKPIARIAMLCSIVCSAGFTFYAISMFRSEISPDQRWTLILALNLVHSVLLLFAPSQRNGWKFLAAFYLLNMTLAMLFAPGLKFSFAVGFTVIPLMLFLKSIMTTFLKNEALTKFRMLELAARVEREKISHELQLARRIQDSFSDTSTFTLSDIRIRLYQSKHENVGGDWCASRSMADGRQVIIVADATGKGMQAALVIHALQALWADDIGRHEFDARVWIERVNAALFRLGRREAQTMTMAILEVNGSQLTYWSAGHTPLYIVRVRPDGSRSVKTLLGQGSLVGFDAGMQLQPATFSIPKEETCHLLMGTDGFFESGTLYSSKEILSIMDRIQVAGASVLGDSQAKDDKTLIWATKVA